MDEISGFFRNSKRIKRIKSEEPDWYESVNQAYTTIYAIEDGRYQRVVFVLDKAVVCPTCRRTDHWKLGGHPEAIVYICEHAPVWAGRGAVRNIVTVPRYFISRVPIAE
jgi:hypothetical protein